MVELNDVKNITFKLLEREELLEINKVQDSLILSYKDLVSNNDAHIDKLNNEISSLNSVIDYNNEINERLSKSLKTQKVLKDVFICTTCIGIASSLILFLRK